MSARLPLLVVLAGLLALPSAASAATKNGVTPVSPKAGKSIPVGKRPVMKMKIRGSGQVYVHVCKSKKKDADGLICFKESIGRAKKKYFLELEDPVKVDLMRRIKTAFDPQGILNPGNLF